MGRELTLYNKGYSSALGKQLLLLVLAIAMHSTCPSNNNTLTLIIKRCLLQIMYKEMSDVYEIGMQESSHVPYYYGIESIITFYREGHFEVN